MSGTRIGAKHVWRLTGCLTLLTLALAACHAPQSIGDSVQDDAHPPRPWRELTASEHTAFDLGYAVFNTDFVPANQPAGRIDGLGPLFNSSSCDTCHNSRRRGRGPLGDGDAPSDLVMQLGRRLPDGRVQRGTEQYGFVLNPAAIQGFKPEARISISYEEQVRTLPDGTQVRLRTPRYHISDLSGPPLPHNTVLMPRLPPPVQGGGLLELVPRAELARLAAAQGSRGGGVHGHVAMLGGIEGNVGRFGWQASEPGVASQIGNAFAREMGLTNPLLARIDCGAQDLACQSAPSGGNPEVEPELFNAVVTFQLLHAVPVQRLPDLSSAGGRLFVQVGCAECHQPSLRVEIGGGTSRSVIHPYTDLLVHDMGDWLADRDLDGQTVHSEWRTAPLWGMNAAYATGQKPRLMHDGRARSIDEAILWHAGEGQTASRRFEELAAQQRHTLVQWVEGL